MVLNGRLLEQCSGSQAAFKATFRITGGYRKARRSFLTGLLEGIFTIIKWFHWISKNIIFAFFSKSKPKIVITISGHSKVQFWFLTFIKNIHLLNMQTQTRETEVKGPRHFYLPPCISSFSWADLYHVTCWGDEGGEAGIKVLSDQLMDSPHWEHEIRFKAKQLTKSKYIILYFNTTVYRH
jgi:hypothetical protein